MSRRVKLVLLIAALQATTLLLAATYVSSLGRRLHKNGRWISTKERLGNIMAAPNWFRKRSTLRKSRLDLGLWYGFQEVVTHKRFDLKEYELDFRLAQDAYVCVLLERTDAGTRGARLSLHKRFPSQFFFEKSSGESIDTQPLEIAGLKPGMWVRARAVYDADGVDLHIDGRRVGRYAYARRGRHPVGVRGCHRQVLVDNIAVRHGDPQRLWEEDFSNSQGFRAALLVGAGVLVLLNLFWWRRRRRSPQPAFVALLRSFLLLFAMGVLFLADEYVFSRHSNTFTDEAREAIGEARRKEVLQLAKPTGGDTTRILFLGTSQTWGSAAAHEEDTFVRVVERMLGPRVACINGGVSGSRAEFLVEYLRSDWLALKPDIVVAHLSNNDLDEETFVSALADLGQLCRERGIGLLFSLEANSIEKTPGELPMHPAMRRVAKRLGVTVVDAHAYMRRQVHRGHCWWDALHPSSFGHFLIAEFLAPRLRGLLPESK